MSTTPIDAALLEQEAADISDTIEALDNERAPLWAVYGYNGTYDDERKALLDLCAIEARGKGEKLTEAHIGQLAHTHDAYRAHLDNAREERMRMALLDAEIASKTRRFELAKEKMANYRKASNV